MNTLLLHYQLGDVQNESFLRSVRRSEFDKLLEMTTPNCYRYSRTKRSSCSVSCLDVDETTGQFLLSSGNDGSVSIWSLDEKLDTIENDLHNKRIQYSSRNVVEEPSSSKKRPRMSSMSPHMVHTFETKQSKFRMYRQSSDLSYLATQEAEASKVNDGHRFGITTVKWYSIDNGMFFTGSNDCKVKIWDTNTFESVQEIDVGFRVNQLDSDIDGKYIVVASEDYYPHIMDLRNIMSSAITNLSSKNMNSEILSCKINPTKPNIVSSADAEGNVKLWDTRMRNTLLLDLNQEGSRRAHSKSCNDLAWNLEGTELASIGNDGRCYIWSPFTTTISCKQIGSMDLMRNRSKKRTSQRLMWYENFLLCNTDYGEIQIFETEGGKLYNKVDFPLLQQSSKLVTQQFTSMAIQRSLANSKGLRLFLGTSSLSSDSIESSGCIYEYL